MIRVRGRRLVGSAAAVAVLSGVIIALTSAPAAAAVTCSASRDWTYTWGAKSTCNGVEPRLNHRVAIKCAYMDGSVPRTGTFLGPWVSTVNVSKQHCPASTTAVLSYWTETYLTED